MDTKMFLCLAIFCITIYQVESKDFKNALKEDYDDKLDVIRNEFDVMHKDINQFTRNMDVRRSLVKFSSMLDSFDDDETRAVVLSQRCLLEKIKATCKTQVSGITLTSLGTGMYYFHTDGSTSGGKTWYQASDFCRQHGMELVSIETEAENNLLKAEVKRILNGQADFQSFFWTSLNDFNTDTEYYWAGTGKSATYFDWLTDNSSPTSGVEHCSEIWQYTNSVGNIHWNDRQCKEWSGRFICEVQEPCLFVV